jgi:hypothetical protein
MGKGNDEVKKLRAKVLELEKVVSTQLKLIEILRTMPGCQEVKLKDGQKGVRKRTQGRGGLVVKDGAKGQSTDRGEQPQGDNKDIEDLGADCGQIPKEAGP